MTCMKSCTRLFVATVAMAAALPASAAGLTLEQTLAKMDQVAAHFKGLSADIQTAQHMEAIHEDDTQTGTILVKHPSRNSLHVKIAIEQPEKKVAYADGNKVDVYYPSSQEIQEVALGHRKSLVDMILTLGFGGNSKELLADYKVTLGGSDTVAGKGATRLELDPTSPDMKEQWKKIELWISDDNGYAVQQKFFEKGNDYTLITYTNVQPKSDISESEFTLPKGAKKEPLNKKK
jgi:outer membrane lipoprotein-sorting protein